MSESQRAVLRQFLLRGYNELKARLTQRLGSAALANDALQDTWLRLERAEPVGQVRHPKAYLLRIAFNIALKHRKAALESVTLEDARIALSLADDAPDPSARVEGRSEIELLQRAISELTARQRDILLASRLDNVPLAELATRHGISQRWVERELRHAVLHCAQRLDRKVNQRFGPRPQKGSMDQEQDIRKSLQDDDAS